MADEKRGWRQFQQIKFNKKNLSRRVKKAEGVTTRHAHKFIVKRLDSIRNVRRRIIGWLLLVGLIIAAVGVQLMWFQYNYMTTARIPGGTYAEAVTGPINTLNPLYAASNSEVAVSRLVFSSLYNYDTTGHLHGDLADDIKVDPSNKIYTVTIRPDAKWHDGAPLTAQDIVYTVNLIKSPGARSALAGSWQDVSAKALDKRTVQFTLPAIYAAFPYALTFAVLPEHILGSVTPSAIRENAFSRSPVGSGPFKFALVQSAGNNDHKIAQMTGASEYYGGVPKLSHFEIHAYSNEEESLKALKSGEVSAVADVSSTGAKAVDNKVYDVASHPVNSGVYALFNEAKPMLNDKRVRLALQLASDTTAIRRNLASGVRALDLPFINGQLVGDVPHASPPNGARAAILLDEAGWKLVGKTREKDGQKLALTITTTKDDQYEKAVKDLATQWRKLGVSITIDVIDRSAPSVNFTQEVLQSRKYDILVYELSIGGDPDVYAYWHSSQIGIGGYNFSNYVSQPADAALSSARSRVEPSLRNAKYIAFARQWLDDVPAIGLYQPVVKYVSNKHVQSVNDSMKFVSSVDRYANVLGWTVRQGLVYKTP